MSSFTVQEVTYFKRYEKFLSLTNKVTGSVSEENDEICTAHLHFIMGVNLFLLIFVVTGCCLDSRKKLNFEPKLQSNNQAVIVEKNKQVPPDASVLSSIGTDAAVTVTEM